MKKFVKSSLVLAMLGTSTLSFAGGLDYSKQSVLPFFEKGNYAEVGYAHVDPKIEGTDAYGTKINDMMDDFDLKSAAVKLAPTEDTSLALLYDNPFGVDTKYQSGSMFSNSIGTTEARISTDSYTLLGGGKVGAKKNIWLYGGLEYQKLKGKVTGAQPVGLESALTQIYADPTSQLLPIKSKQEYLNIYAQKLAGTISASDQAKLDGVDNLLNYVGGTPNNKVSDIANAPTLYQLDFENADTIVPVVGVGYEIPEILLRASVTYRAPAKYTVKGKESLSSILPPVAGGDGVTPQPVVDNGVTLKDIPGSVSFKMPQSVNLDFQTGLSEKYKLMGMVNARWVNWKQFKVAPEVASGATGEPLASYPKDAYAVEVALGHEFSPQLSGEVRVGYDSGTGTPLSLLGPYDATKTLGVGLQYNVNKALSLSGGAQYMWFDGGEVSTKNDGVVAKIDDGTGYAIGAKIGYHF